MPQRKALWWRLVPLIAGAVLFTVSPARAQLATGVATEYIIEVQKIDEVQKIEKCTSASCGTSFVLGSSTTSFDIAAASVGAAIGSYASTDGLPIGTTFTHVRVTLSRTIKITGAATDGALAGISANTCTTDAGNDGGASGAAATAADGVEGAATATQQDLFVPTPTSFSGLPTELSYTNAGIFLPMDSTSFKITYELTSPHTVTDQPPLISVKFGTQTALGAFNDSNACKMVPQPPSVTITVQ